MARRRKKKKINRRVLITLIIVGAVLVSVGVGAAALKFWPRDPHQHRELARAAGEAGDSETALRHYAIAETAARRRDDLALQSDILYEVAQYCKDMLQQPGLRRSEYDTFRTRMLGVLARAVQVNPRHLDAQRMLEQFWWEPVEHFARTGRADAQMLVTHFREIDNLIKIQPDEPSNYYRRGVTRSLQAVAQPALLEQALADLDRAIEGDPEQSRYWIDRARAPLRQSDVTLEHYAQAEETFHKALERLDEDIPLRIAYGQFLDHRNRHDEAAAQYRRALEIDPQSVPANLAYARHGMLRGDVDLAMSVIERARQVAPDDIEVDLLEADLLGRLRRHAEAGELFVRIRNKRQAQYDALPAAQRSLPVQQAHTEHMSTFEFHAARSFLLAASVATPGEQRQQYVDRVREHMQRMERLGVQGSDSPLRRELEGRLAHLEGRLGDARRHLAAAHEAYRRVGASDPQLGYLLAQLYLAGNQPTMAEELVRELLAGPGRGVPAVHMADGLIRVQYRQYREAMEAFDRALSLAPDMADARMWRGTMVVLTSQTGAIPADLELSPAARGLILSEADRLWHQQHEDRAIQLAENLRRHAEEDTEATALLLRFYSARNDLQQVQLLLTQAVERHPDNEAFRNQLAGMENPSGMSYEQWMAQADNIEDPLERAQQKARVALVSQRYAEAFGFLEEVARLNPGSPVGLVPALVETAIRAGNLPGARQWLARGREAGLDDRAALLLQAELEAAGGEPQKAIASLRQVLDENPGLTVLWVKLGDLYLQTAMADQARAVEQAEQAYDRALRNDASHAPALIGKARVAEWRGHGRRYRELIRAAYDLAPQNLEVRHRYMTILAAENVSAAVQGREAIRRDAPAHLGNLVALAELYERADQPGRAEELYRWLFTSVQPRLEGARLLGQFYARQGRFAEVEAIVAAAPEDRVGMFIVYGDILARYRPDQARPAFERAVAEAPDDARVHAAMARFLTGRREWSEAAAFARRAIELGWDDAEMNRMLTISLIEAGDIPAAQQRIDRQLRADPRNVEALAMRGLALSRAGNPQGALRALDQALEVNPDSVQSLEFRASVREKQGDLRGAAADLQQAWQASGLQARSGMNLAEIRLRLGERDRAAEVLAAIVEREPGHIDAFTGLLRLRMQQDNWGAVERLLQQAQPVYPGFAPLWEAEMWRHRGQPDRAVQILAQAMRQARPSVVVFDAYLQSLLQANRHEAIVEAVAEQTGRMPADWIGNRLYPAMSWVALGQQERADELFREALRTAEGQNALLVLQRLRDAYGLNGALERMEAWMDESPERLLILDRLATLYVERGDAGDADKATALLRQALTLTEIPQQQATLHRGMGLAYYSMGQYRPAADAFRRTIEIFPNDLVSLNNLAYIYADKLDEGPRAVTYGQRAYQLHPNNASVLDTYGWALARAGRYREAVDYLLRAVNQDGSQALLRYHLAWAYEHNNQLNQALDEYRRAIVLLDGNASDPLYEPLREGEMRVRGKLTQ